jgi:GNAT superfamily N-acetyltransferase
MDARQLSVAETLRNGTSITIRAARPADRDRIVTAFRGLERESVYTRFFSYKAELSPAELARLDTMDFVHEAMLVATIATSGDEIVIGSARYITESATPNELAAEVAFAVEEDYQGLGIAGRLLHHLITIARANGISRFIADVLPGNKAMLAVFKRTGLPVRERRESGVVHLDIALQPATASNGR